jgi:hypothetical protein
MTDELISYDMNDHDMGIVLWALRHTLTDLKKGDEKSSTHDHERLRKIYQRLQKEYFAK